MTRIRQRLSYANVMATVAVFIALGGGAYAALKVPKKSVGNAQLKNNAVTLHKIANSSVNGNKVKDASLTGADVKARSLTADNIAQLGLSNLLGASGTATNDAAVTLAAGTCDRYVFSANGVQPGDAVILGGSDIAALNNASISGPTVSNINKINATVCAGTGNPVNQAVNAIQLRFDTLR
jgi:hypothetical protein